jgi:hypothetical protein
MIYYCRIFNFTNNSFLYHSGVIIDIGLRILHPWSLGNTAAKMTGKKGNRKRASYNSRFQEEEPDEVAPKTTKWRLKKRLNGMAMVSGCPLNA